MKKFVYLLIVILLSMSFVFSACGDDDDDDNDDAHTADDDDDADDDTDDDDDEESYEGWEKIAVEPTLGWSLQKPRIAVDSQNRTHIVFSISSDEINFDLNYSLIDGEQIVTERIDQLVSVWSPTIAIDNQDAVHICYYNSLTAEVTYATNRSGAWEYEGIVEEMPLSHQFTMAVDSNGAVALVYGLFDGDYHCLVLVHNRSGNWQREVIWVQQYACDCPVGQEPQIRFDGDDNMHILFNEIYDSQLGNVKLHYLHQEDDQWIDEEILVDHMPLGPIELEVEADGTVHMSCVRSEGGVYFLKYIRGTAGNWQNDFVPIADSENLVDQKFSSAYFSMDLGPSGEVYFALHLPFDDECRLLFISLENDEWSRELLFWFYMDHWVDLAIDSAGKAHMVRKDYDQESYEENHNLWYVTNAL
ncbi:MAG TPA: hypothetical protein PKW95_13700 [bacterium]|nr:hypothetical protein [bacterium]